MRFIVFFCFSLFLCNPCAFSSARAALYNSLDPNSFAQQMTFYELFKETPEGEKAWRRASSLLLKKASAEGSAHIDASLSPTMAHPLCDIQPIISLLTRQSFEAPVVLEDKQLHLINSLSAHLHHKQLRGHHIWNKEEMALLPAQEIDLCRALLLEELGDDKEQIKAIEQYEALLDLMALQILVRLGPEPKAEEIIEQISYYIFHEMHFRFPPHSLHVKDIDLYTFLPSVLDRRQGVCLGVSILYLCLAQRMNVALEIITPPGHIYLRYRRDDGSTLNIETTARGIHLPDEAYLGINTRLLQQRTIKEVVGMAFFNEASRHWSHQDYSKSTLLYEKARTYMDRDPLLTLFLGLSYLFSGEVTKGEIHLAPLRDYLFDYAVSKETMITDYFTKKTTIDGLQMIFLPVDETRESILRKQEELKKYITRYPHFRAGLFQLAITYLQLSCFSQAKEILNMYHEIDPTDASVEYYLAVIAKEHMDFQKAWHHLRIAESLTRSRDHKAAALQELRLGLRAVCPEAGM